MLSTPWSRVARTLFVTSQAVDITTAWRAWWPCSELTARGYVADFIKYSELNQLWPVILRGRYNMVVTPRVAFDTAEGEQNWLDIVQQLHAANIYWCIDVDDDLFSEHYIARSVRLYALDKDPAKREQTLRAHRDARLRLMQHADGITAASQYLSDYVRTLTPKPVMYVPNGVNLELFQNRLEVGQRSVPPVTIGWSGGPRIEEDLQPLYKVWKHVAELRPNVRFVMQGWCPKQMQDVLPSERLTVIPGVPFEQHPAILKNIDIFCCVSTSDPFNLAKTPIKWIEATLAGAVCVGSSHLYGEVIPWMRVAETTQQWIECLLQLVDSEQKRQQARMYDLELIRSQHTLASTYIRWIEAWSSVLP